MQRGKSIPMYTEDGVSNWRGKRFKGKEGHQKQYYRKFTRTHFLRLQRLEILNESSFLTNDPTGR